MHMVRETIEASNAIVKELDKARDSMQQLFLTDSTGLKIQLDVEAISLLRAYYSSKTKWGSSMVNYG